MNQEKIGKFINERRHFKKLTQQELATLLGVSDKTIGNWENGRNMPDVSLFIPLCEILEITVNELLSGEKLKQDNYQEKFEENIANTLNYSKQKIQKYKQIVSLIIIVFGLFITLSAIMIFPSESSWGSIYSILGLLISMVGIFRTMSTFKWYKRLLITFLIFICSMGFLLFIDYLNVKLNDEAPMFRIITTTTGNVIYYNTPFYDVYRCNYDEVNEYWVIKSNEKVTINKLLNFCKE